MVPAEKVATLPRQEAVEAMEEQRCRGTRAAGAEGAMLIMEWMEWLAVFLEAAAENPTRTAGWEAVALGVVAAGVSVAEVGRVISEVGAAEAGILAAMAGPTRGAAREGPRTMSKESIRFFFPMRVRQRMDW
jgi:hypothetical protein